MEFTKQELTRIVSALKQDNVRAEFDLVYEDLKPFRKQILIGKIKRNEDLINKIKKGM